MLFGDGVGDSTMADGLEVETLKASQTRPLDFLRLQFFVCPNAVAWPWRGALCCVLVCVCVCVCSRVPFLGGFLREAKGTITNLEVPDSTPF